MPSTNSNSNHNPTNKGIAIKITSVCTWKLEGINNTNTPINQRT